VLLSQSKIEYPTLTTLLLFLVPVLHQLRRCHQCVGRCLFLWPRSPTVTTWNRYSIVLLSQCKIEYPTLTTLHLITVNWTTPTSILWSSSWSVMWIVFLYSTYRDRYVGRCRIFDFDVGNWYSLSLRRSLQYSLIDHCHIFDIKQWSLLLWNRYSILVLLQSKFEYPTLTTLLLSTVSRTPSTSILWWSQCRS
jgi:hypothetical protein